MSYDKTFREAVFKALDIVKDFSHYRDSFTIIADGKQRRFFVSLTKIGDKFTFSVIEVNV